MEGYEDPPFSFHRKSQGVCLSGLIGFFFSLLTSMYIALRQNQCISLQRVDFKLETTSSERFHGGFTTAGPRFVVWSTRTDRTVICRSAAIGAKEFATLPFRPFSLEECEKQKREREAEIFHVKGEKPVVAPAEKHSDQIEPGSFSPPRWSFSPTRDKQGVLLFFFSILSSVFLELLLT